MEIKKGHLVEFTRVHHSNYTIGQADAEFGVAVEDSEDGYSALVELASGEKYRAIHIHAYAWGGWIPDELEQVWEKYSPETFSDDEDLDW